MHATVSLSSQEFRSSETRSIHKAGFVVHPELRPYIRLPGYSEDHLASSDSGFTITFLGTGASMSPFRSHTCSALRMGGKTFLFDAGDGMQRQLMLSRVNMGEIEKIFSTSNPSSSILPLFFQLASHFWQLPIFTEITSLVYRAFYCFYRSLHQYNNYHHQKPFKFMVQSGYSILLRRR